MFFGAAQQVAVDFSAFSVYYSCHEFIELRELVLAEQNFCVVQISRHGQWLLFDVLQIPSEIFSIVLNFHFEFRTRLMSNQQKLNINQTEDRNRTNLFFAP